uniref:Uncharacterized protein n=1 Tax=Anguilla anguilla TaxID=7936 RepID=A0A0E9PV67_ANGAN
MAVTIIVTPSLKTIQKHRWCSIQVFYFSSAFDFFPFVFSRYQWVLLEHLWQCCCTCQLACIINYSLKTVTWILIKKN